MLSYNSFRPSNWDFSDDMAHRKFPEKVSCDSYRRSKSEFYIPIEDVDKLGRSISPDEVDNPRLEKSVSAEKLFDIMKHEINRLNSYTGKWPLRYIKPAHLAENGLFYLQSEDKVQCAFCHVVIDDWNVGDKPLKEHMKKSPKCPFLLTFNVGNVPMSPQKSVKSVSKECTPGGISKINSSSYKPKHPRMADLRSRLMTYKDWPLIMLSSKQLAECGLYYTGVADVVTCFFCGGSLGNWELNDDPWVEHTKFFPSCAYLSLIKKHGRFQSQLSQPTVQLPMGEQSSRPSPTFVPAVNLNPCMESEAIRQASDIFSRALVQKVVTHHMKESNRVFSTLNELCEAILEYEERESTLRATNSVPKTDTNTDIVCSDPSVLAKQNGATITKEVKDALICKICMDREMGVVFQPCGHLVSCPQCAQLIFNCPLCRTAVTSKVRTYLS